MPLSGNLETMPLPDLLQWLGASGKTGTLEIGREKVCKTIVFLEGRVVSCSSEDPPAKLGHFLLSQGRITENHLRQALVAQEASAEHLGAILVRMGALTAEELMVQLAAKTEETVTSLFDWPDAEFRFYEGAAADRQVFPTDLRVEEILLRGVVRYDEARRIRAVFRDPGIVLCRSGKTPPPEVFQNRMARRIYGLVTGERTVAEILLHAHASEFLVTKFLFELFRSGYVTMAEIRDTGPQGAPPPEPPDTGRSAGTAGGAVAAPAPSPAPPPAAATAIHAGHATPSVSAVAPAPARTLESDLSEARQLTQRGEIDAALDVLNAAYRDHPGDDSLRRLIAEAEAAFVEKAYRHYLPPGRVPVLTRPIESLTADSLSPIEYFLLSRIDGVWDVKSIIQIAPIREVDALLTLKRMREKGVIDLRNPA